MLIPIGFFEAGGASGAYELISTTTVSGGAVASVTFNNSGTWDAYKHLQIRFTARCDGFVQQTPFRFTFNGDTGANYSRHWLRGDGSSVVANAGSSENSLWANYVLGAVATASAYTAGVIDILDHASTSKNTTARIMIGSYGSSGGHTQISLSSGGWYNTAALTSINLFAQSYNLENNSRFSIYGIKGV